MNKFGIILGEPNSINIEILAKSNALKKRCIIIGSFNLLNAQLKILNSSMKNKSCNIYELIVLRKTSSNLVIQT